MQRPNDSDTFFVSDLRDDRRQLRVYVVQMHHVRLEVLKQLRELPLCLSITERSCESLQLAHVRREISLPRCLQVFWVIHGKHSHLMPMSLQQLLKIEHVDAVTTTTVVELVC